MSPARIRHALVLAAALLAGGCAGSEAAAPTMNAAPPPPLSVAIPEGQAERVAEALLMAERAERAGDQAALAQAAERLDRLGAAPQTEADMARLGGWMASLPATAAPMRGRALGPAYRSAALDPGGRTQLNQTFLGGRSAQIVLRVSRGPVPRLVVRDQADRQVCKAPADDPVKCRWVPIYTQRHSIEIVNTGPQMSEFYIVFD
jgi:hypothetical protein